MMLSRWLGLVFLGAVVWGQTGSVTTVAGDGNAGFWGDFGPAVQAQFLRVTGVAVDAAGNMYLADESGHRIRRVDRSGVITTFAGIGTPGFAGDGGAATAAQLYLPSCVAVDVAGTVYVCDSGNRRIRAIDAKGIIITVAGNGALTASGDGKSALAAGIGQPVRAALDGLGNVYIVDQANHVVRKFAAGGVISTIAGNRVRGFSGDGGPATAASLNTPTAVTVDPLGNVIVSDQGNQRLRKIDTAGNISTLAGSAQTGYSADNAPAVTAYLNQPGGVVADGAGDIYFCDIQNQRIRKVRGELISTVAGTGEQGYAGDNGPPLKAAFNEPIAIAVDPTGNLYIADTSNYRVRRITGVAAGLGPLFAASGVTNAASFQAGMAPGGIITVFGHNLSTGVKDFVLADTVPWPAELAGTRVLVDGQPAPVYAVVNMNGTEQVSFQAPFSLAGHASAHVAVANSRGTSLAAEVPVLAAHPGIFLVGNNGAILHGSDNSLVGPSSPAAKGEVVMIYLTGLGTVTNRYRCAGVANDAFGDGP